MQPPCVQSTAEKLAGGDGRRGGWQEAERHLGHLDGLRRDASTGGRHRRGLLRFQEFLLARGIGDLRAVRRSDITDFRSELAGQGLPSHAVRSCLGSVRGLFAFLKREGAVLIDPADGLRLPKPERRLPRAVLTRAEMGRLLDAPDTLTLRGLRDRAILEVLYSTAVRVAELCRLTVHDMDVDAGIVRVNGGKGAKDRLVPLGAVACKWVTAYLVQSGSGRRAVDGLFLGKRGQPLGPRQVQNIVRYYSAAAGILKPVSPHVLRHTCATRMLAGGADATHVQRLLGHARLSTTQRYTRVAIVEIKRTHQLTHPRERWED